MIIYIYIHYRINLHSGKCQFLFSIFSRQLDVLCIQRERERERERRGEEGGREKLQFFSRPAKLIIAAERVEPNMAVNQKLVKGILELAIFAHVFAWNFVA